MFGEMAQLRNTPRTLGIEKSYLTIKNSGHF